jgi:hypothetical protein
MDEKAIEAALRVHPEFGPGGLTMKRSEERITVHKFGNGSFVAFRETPSGDKLPDIIGRVRDGNSIVSHEAATGLTADQEASLERIKTHVLARLLSGEVLDARSARQEARIILFGDGEFADTFGPFRQMATVHNVVLPEQMKVLHALEDLMTLLGYTPLLVTTSDAEGHLVTNCVATPTENLYPTQTGF